MPKQFTRQEFYDLIWSKPITHVAKDFALSDVAIHKICKKHDIPNPPLGWWAKKTHGKPVAQIPLPDLKEDVPAVITIVEGSLLREGDNLKAAREKARIAATASAEQTSPPRNSIVEKTMLALRKEKPNDRGLVSITRPGLIEVAVAVGSLDRLEVVLERIVHAASIQGFTLTKSEDSTRLVGHDESIKFQFVETVKRIKHVMTPEELAEQERKRRHRHRDSWNDDFWFGLGLPQWDYIPTGQLALELEHFYVWKGTAPRRAFKDGKSQRLEDMAAEIAVGLAVYAAGKKEKRLADEERAREAEEERRQREIAQRRHHIAERRLAELDSILVDLEKVERFRTLVASLNSQLGVQSEGRVGEFLQWAEQRLQKSEDQLTAAGLEQRFQEKRVFGDDDDHGFFPNRWM